MRRRLVSGAAVFAVLACVLCSPGIASAHDAVPAGPSPEALVQATNAMLRPADVPKTYPNIRDGGVEFDTGYRTSYWGTDDFDVCFDPLTAMPVKVSWWNGATIYEASYGARDDIAARVNQWVYDYPTPDAALKAWTDFSKSATAKCNGSHTVDGISYVAKTTPVVGVEGVRGLGVYMFSSNPDSYKYTVVNLIGSSIQMVGGYDGDTNPLKDGRAATVRKIAAELTVRWQSRAQLPITQNPLITRAASTMIQPSDLTPATPILQPGRGGDSYFANRANALSLCSQDVTSPAPHDSFRTSLGVGEPPASIPGDIDQTMYVYSSASAAKNAWSQLTKILSSCTSKAKASASGMTTKQGVSPLTFNGVAGIWTRSWWKPEPISESDYGLYLLVGNAIQVVSYSRALKGDTSAPIDQAAVNKLAESLALRWSGSLR